jgi:ferredoxin-NADP reductase
VPSRKGLRPLVVTRIHAESSDILSLELEDAGGGALPPWEPGAHVDVQLITRQQRQYSLCGDPGDRFRYRIAVLREELSRGASLYIHGHLREGRTVYVGEPRNLFPLLPAERYLLLAAGIGITPLLPMSRELERRGAEWSMHYAVRGADRLPFRSELEEFGDRVTVHSRDHAARLDLPGLLAESRRRHGLAVYSCGPARFTEGVEEAMSAWPPGSLHLERFEPKAGIVRPNEPFTVVCARSEKAVEVPAELTMLKALEIAGVELPGSCLRGVCGACAVTVVAGHAEHRDSLTTDEASATLYPCVSRSLTPELTIDL